MAHQVQIKELVNGVEITETIDSNILISVLSYNAKPFFRSTNEEDVDSFQIIDRIGEIYHLPALATEFTLIDINGNYFIPANGEELIEYSYKIRIFRPENEFDKVLNVGTVEATANTVKVNIPSVGLPNSVLINGSVYENYYPSLFNFVAVVEFTKILIVYAKPDNTVFYLAQGVEALSAVEPDYEGLFVARIIASIDGNIIEYPNYGVITEDSDTVAFTGNGTVGNPLSAESVGGGTSDLTLEQARQNGNVLEGDVEVKDSYSRFISNSENAIFTLKPDIENNGEVVLDYRHNEDSFRNTILMSNGYLNLQYLKKNEADVINSTVIFLSEKEIKINIKRLFEVEGSLSEKRQEHRKFAKEINL